MPDAKATCYDVVKSDPWRCAGCGKQTDRKVHAIKHVDWPHTLYNDCPGWYLCCDECAAIVAERRIALIQGAGKKGAAHDTKGS